MAWHSLHIRNHKLQQHTYYKIFSLFWQAVYPPFSFRIFFPQFLAFFSFFCYNYFATIRGVTKNKTAAYNDSLLVTTM